MYLLIEYYCYFIKNSRMKLNKLRVINPSLVGIKFGDSLVAVG